MSKIVYNACFGGFGLSEAAVMRYAEIKGFKLWPESNPPFSYKTYWKVPPEQQPKKLDGAAWLAAPEEERSVYNKAWAENVFRPDDLRRDDSVLVQVVEELGRKADGAYADLRIAEVPSGSKYRIDEYDGSEFVETPDSYEWEIAP